MNKLNIMKNNIVIRLISGLILGSLFLVAIFWVRPLLYVIFYLIAALMLIEWYNMTKTSKLHNLLGQVIIPIPIASLLLISYFDHHGWLLLTYFCIIWSVDTMAMFGGKLIGGAKLAPTISPNKTISGLIFGVTSAVIVVNVLTMLPAYQLPAVITLSNLKLSIYTTILGLIAQLSDLTISIFKRKFNIKDTGTIIPGHGGALDRFDSIILTAPIVAVFFIYSYV
ncbi:MAG: phosphatidate cytidylyltransferase [Rickettsiaceae bacterium]